MCEATCENCGVSADYDPEVCLCPNCEFDAFDTLLRLLNLPQSIRSPCTGICRTSDGHYMLRNVGDTGYDRFLGKPSPVHEGPGLTQTLALWATLNSHQRAAVRAEAANPDGPIILSEFGIP